MSRLCVKNSLMQLLGISEFRVEVSSSAVRLGAARVCVLVLDASATQALLVNGGANVSAPDCEVHVRSTANPAAIFNAGTTLDTSRLCIAGC